MLFNTLEYLVFLPSVIFIFYLLPQRHRWILLLLSSYYFYMCWKTEYLVLIVASTAIDYFASIKMGKIKEKRRRIPYLVLSLMSNLGILFSFKYFNFFGDSLHVILDQFNILVKIPELNVLLPVGISFYTFQTLSYSIEVYQGKQEPEKHFGYFAVYVAFFPQLVAGPIERFSRLGPQFRAKSVLNYENISNGLRLILYGLFIKMVIADNISSYVDIIYKSPKDHNTINILTGIFFYSFQIYSDFYGYSLIAIGSAKLLGISLMDNFKTPYMAKGIAEFWQRWHISLSTWFRDYLYFPLGGNRVKLARWFTNVFIVFTVSGLWHGANWTFVIWGAIHGVLYILENRLNKVFNIKLNDKVSFINVVFMIKNFIVVTFIWLFFRSTSMGNLKEMFVSIKTNLHLEDGFFVERRIWILLIFFILTDMLFYNTRFDKWCSTKPLIVRWGLYAVLLFSIIVFSGVENFPFIYFQF